MLCFRCIEENSSLCQILQNFRITGDCSCFHFLLGRFAAHAGKFTGFRFHLTCAVHHLYERSVVFTSDSGIIFTECRCNVYDTGTVGHGYIFITIYEECFLMLLLGFHSRTLIKRFVFLIFKVGTLVGFQNFICLTVCKGSKFCIALFVLGI